MKFFHLNDNSQYISKGEPGHDPLYKLRPFLDPLITNFKDAYTPGRELSVDEPDDQLQGPSVVDTVNA